MPAFERRDEARRECQHARVRPNVSLVLVLAGRKIPAPVRLSAPRSPTTLPSPQRRSRRESEVLVAVLGHPEPLELVVPERLVARPHLPEAWVLRRGLLVQLIRGAPRSLQDLARPAPQLRAAGHQPAQRLWVPLIVAGGHLHR